MIDECCDHKTQHISCKRKQTVVTVGLRFSRFWTENVGDVELPLDVNQVMGFNRLELCIQQMVIATKKWYLDRMLGIHPPPETCEPENPQTWRSEIPLCKIESFHKLLRSKQVSHLVDVLSLNCIAMTVHLSVRGTNLGRPLREALLQTRH